MWLTLTIGGYKADGGLKGGWWEAAAESSTISGSLLFLSYPLIFQNTAFSPSTRLPRLACAPAALPEAEFRVNH